jgi:hypothetical protein
VESNSNDKIIEVSEKIVMHLKNNGEEHWSSVIKKIHDEYIASGRKPEVAKKFVTIMRGGMGSFLDLVLHKDRKPLINENNRLDELRHELYEECKKTL